MISNRAPGPASALQGRAWALPLLIMVVLCGLLTMHGLGAVPAGEAHPHSAAHSAPEAAAAGGHDAGVHDDGSRLRPGGQHADQCECDGTDGHVSHADATCSATGTSGSPSTDGPASTTAAAPRHEAAPGGRCRPDTGTERAPPSLHRLQLLRI
ncbi:DUF6153 family protein [Streptomyces sp. WMMB 322]|uniref:DUF6153 family protein n=1 Tax=Streptomyces sp. WMMB 322 TaxID=1286821 RepID=UPI0020C7A9E9|nr:DUF6153 family protein [Streptomyces sp. WMMB 322]